MPLYEYRCYYCGYVFERLHYPIDDEPEKCPKCGELSDKVDSVPAPMVWGKGGTWNK